MSIPIRAKRIRRIHIPCKASHSSSLFEKDFQMLQYFQDEFMYRHKHFWQLLFKLFTLSIAVTIIPLTSQVFDIKFSETIKAFSYWFPFMGLLIAILGTYLLQSEAKRMSAVGSAKSTLSKKMGERYQYQYFDENAKNSSSLKDINKKKHLAHQLPIIVFLVELVIIILVAVILWRTPVHPT